jgi:hypothetical protein
MAGDLADMFPGARFLHILRDGRRVVHSMVNFLSGQSERVQAQLKQRGVGIPWLDFREACKTWRLYVELALDFAAGNPARCLTVVNERLVEDPQKCFGEIFDFLEVPYQDGPADYFRSHRINSSFPETTGSRGTPYQLSEPWKKWTPKQTSLFQEKAGVLLERCGFVPGRCPGSAGSARTGVGSDSLIPDGQWAATSATIAGMRAPENLIPPDGTGKHQRYDRMIERIRDTVRSTIPAQATLIIVSHGDDNLLNMDGREAWHFPQGPGGVYAGFYPADGAGVVAHLEDLRAKGASHFLLPSTELWWLKHYALLKDHLERHYRTLVRQDDTCVIFALAE